jgi:hypothetical protein
LKDINGHRISFTKADLAHLDEGQLKIICVFSHVLNRLKMLESQVYSHTNMLNKSRENVRTEFSLCAAIESMILIAGELKEAWEAIQQCYYGTKVSKTMNASLPKEIQEALKRLPTYFTGDSLTMFLRNNFAYHNSPDTALDTLKLKGSDAPMAFYYIDEENIYFDYATDIRLSAIANWLGHPDLSTVISPLMETIMGKVFNDVYITMAVIAHNILLTVKHERSSVVLKGVSSDKELSAEVFSYMHERP